MFFVYLTQKNPLLLFHYAIYPQPTITGQMAKGEETPKLELARRHATGAEELARILASPAPTP
jgi:hypothetical protein